MDKIGIGSILKVREDELFMVKDELFMVIGLDGRTIPPLLRLKSLRHGYTFLATEDDYELFC